MNRRGFFGRVIGVAGGVVAAGVVGRPRTTQAVQALPPRQATFSSRDMLRDSLLIERHPEYETCSFETLAAPPRLGTGIRVSLPEIGVVFVGIVTRTTVNNGSSHHGSRSRVEASTCWR